MTGLVVMGFGVGAELVSGFILALQEATYVYSLTGAYYIVCYLFFI